MNIEVTTTFNAPIDTLWQHVAEDLTGIQSWSSAVVASASRAA